MTAALRDEQPPSLREQVAEEVRVWLARRRMSGAELSRRLGRSQTFVAKRLDGRQAMDLDDLQAIAQELRIPVAALIPSGNTTRGDTRSSNHEYVAGNGASVTDLSQVRRDRRTHPARVLVRTSDATADVS